MKYYMVEFDRIEKVNIKKSIAIEDCFDIVYPNGHVSYCIDKHILKNSGASNKKDATTMFNKNILSRIEFYTTEINKLKNTMLI